MKAVYGFIQSSSGIALKSKGCCCSVGYQNGALAAVAVDAKAFIGEGFLAGAVGVTRERFKWEPGAHGCLLSTGTLGIDDSGKLDSQGMFSSYL
jgi:hypothetical protein